MSACAKSPAAAARPAPKARCGAAVAPERSEWCERGSARAGCYKYCPVLLTVSIDLPASVPLPDTSVRM